MNERWNQILELLTKNDRIDVNVFSDVLGVSQVTIRKDLVALEKQGLIVRKHGYARLASADDITGRIAYHYEAKKMIAEKAASLVNDGETIMIESGSCCALLAEKLAAAKKDLTLITNSVFIVDYIRCNTDFQIIMLGGIFQKEARINVGPMVRQCAENFYVDKFFIGTDGYSKRTGFTNKDQLRAQAVRDMARQAEHVIVLTESEKFGKVGTVPLNISNAIDCVVTDDQVEESIKAELEKSGIQIL